MDRILKNSFTILYCAAAATGLAIAGLGIKNIVSSKMKEYEQLKQVMPIERPQNAR